MSEVDYVGRTYFAERGPYRGQTLTIREWVFPSTGRDLYAVENEYGHMLGGDGFSPPSGQQVRHVVDAQDVLWKELREGFAKHPLVVERTKQTLWERVRAWFSYNALPESKEELLWDYFREGFRCGILYPHRNDLVAQEQEVFELGVQVARELFVGEEEEEEETIPTRESY